MKKVVALSRIIFFALVLLCIPGCEKETPPTPITPPVKELSLSLRATPETLEPDGGVSIIEIIAVADSTVSDLPGATLILGSFTKQVETPVLKKTTTFNFRSYLKGKVLYRYVSVYVTKLPQPTISLSSSVDTLPIGGGEVIITITSTQTDTVVSLFDGKILPPNCVDTHFIDTTTSFIYEAHGPGGMKSKSITIFVKEPPPPLTTAELLCLAPWRRSQLEFKYPGDENWYEAVIDECLLDDIITFYIDNTSLSNFGEIKCNENMPNFAYGPWILDGDSLCLGDPRGLWSEITHISTDTIVWVYCFGDGGCTRETRVHP